MQADELWVKVVGGKVWMALALAVPSRLWLGRVISRSRDLPLITRLVQRVRACAVTPAILVCVDGLASDVTASLKAFRQPDYTGRPGRPHLVLPAGFQFAQSCPELAEGSSSTRPRGASSTSRTGACAAPWPASRRS